MSEVTPAPPAVTEGGRSVFVDERGVRARRIAWAGRVFAVGFALYLAAMVASLVGASWVPKAGLPGVVTSALPAHTTTRVTLPESALRLPSPVPVAASASIKKTATTSPAKSGGSGTGSGSTVPTATTTPPTTRPGNRPNATTPNPTATTTGPGNSGTAPGHGKKP